MPSGDEMDHHVVPPTLYAANVGAVFSQIGGHIGDVAAALTIVVNLIALYKLIRRRKRG